MESIEKALQELAKAVESNDEVERIKVTITLFSWFPSPRGDKLQYFIEPCQLKYAACFRPLAGINDSFPLCQPCNSRHVSVPSRG